ncbi:sensor histidine kinase [Plantactinospora sp. CA-290183]|uniref:sensor histidine kinase n=1 Tax=Plantactinospora sp. CA-290183 TaxID=3240006 RepID=UPI003D932FB4
MPIRAALAPLTSGSTYRRGTFLLLGGVLLLPYVLLTVAFTQMLADGAVPRAATMVVLAVAAVIAAVPLFLRGTRALEIAAVRALLDVDLPDPAPGAGIDRETRLRSALWIGTHLLVGGLVGLGLVAALPMALLFIAQRFGVSTGAITGLRIGPLDEGDSGWLTLTGVLLLVLIGYAVAGLGALATVMAPVLLGPSQTERIAALEHRAGRLAERNRLARELHDSVGHALTVATLQAAAAGELLDRDPEFARRALRAIEETGRAAMADLDHVLGLLRQRDGDDQRYGDDQRDDSAGAGAAGGAAGVGDDGLAPQRTLAELDRLVADTRATGLPVTVERDGALEALPAVVSREGYRIVQEGLTNAARHAGGRAVTLRIAVPAGSLEIDLVNALDGPPGRPAGAGSDRAAGRRRRGRGLAGMRERVLLLGGRMTAGPADGAWRVAVRLPTGTAGERET